jgi:hypothetical protein
VVKKEEEEEVEIAIAKEGKKVKEGAIHVVVVVVLPPYIMHMP